MKYLGIDYGDSKIGLALGDDESKIALPHKIIKNSGQADFIKNLKEIIKLENIEKVIIGLPTNLKKESTIQTLKVKEVIEKIKLELDCEVDFIDERLSSVEAQKLRSGKRDDDIAAMIILQNYFDSEL